MAAQPVEIRNVLPDPSQMKDSMLEENFPPFVSAFPCLLKVLGLLEGKTVADIREQLDQDYKSTMLANWGVFVPAAVINLAFCPPELRVLFLNVRGEQGPGWLLLCFVFAQCCGLVPAVCFFHCSCLSLLPPAALGRVRLAFSQRAAIASRVVMWSTVAICNSSCRLLRGQRTFSHRSMRRAGAGDIDDQLPPVYRVYFAFLYVAVATAGLFDFSLHLQSGVFSAQSGLPCADRKSVV